MCSIYFKALASNQLVCGTTAETMCTMQPLSQPPHPTADTATHQQLNNPARVAHDAPPVDPAARPMTVTANNTQDSADALTVDDSSVGLTTTIPLTPWYFNSTKCYCSQRCRATMAADLACNPQTYSRASGNTITSDWLCRSQQCSQHALHTVGCGTQSMYGTTHRKGSSIHKRTPFQTMPPLPRPCVAYHCRR